VDGQPNLLLEQELINIAVKAANTAIKRSFFILLDY
jgi:hypothetical protein